MRLRHSAFHAAVIAVGLAVNATAVVHASSPPQIAIIGDSYTTGSPEGGGGSKSWPAIAGQLLSAEGVEVRANVAAEGGAGYGQPGHLGSVFGDLTAQAVRHNDALVVFFGSRNDEPVDPQRFPGMAANTFQMARRSAPGAKLLVIGPPWPTAAPPQAVLRIRDNLRDQAFAAGAVFVDPIAQGWFVGRPDLIGPDGVHPTDGGHAYMAVKIAPLIYDQLSVQI